MNRNDTKILVENWRKVLNEGLHESDLEILEEGKIANIGMISAAVLSFLFAETSDAKKITNPAQQTNDIISSVLGEKDVYAGQIRPNILRVYKNTPESLKSEVDQKVIVPYLEEVKKSLSKDSEGGLDITRQEKQSLGEKFSNLSASFVKYIHNKIKNKKAKNSSKENTVFKKYNTGLLNKLSEEERAKWDAAVESQDTEAQAKILKTLSLK